VRDGQRVGALVAQTKGIQTPIKIPMCYGRTACGKLRFPSFRALVIARSFPGGQPHLPGAQAAPVAALLPLMLFPGLSTVASAGDQLRVAPLQR